MKAAIINQYSSSDVLHLAELPTPEVKSNQVLIRVHAAGVNPSDWHLRRGDFKMIPVKFPKVLGSECAGVVEAAGTSTSRFRIGDREWLCWVMPGRLCRTGCRQ